MAEIISRSNAKQSGFAKQSIRVDLTPMVDLGFLLIIFFVFTAALSEARALPLIVPPDNNTQPPPKVSADNTLQIFPDRDNSVYYSFGDQPMLMRQTNYAPSGIRAIIQTKQQELAQQGKAGKLIVLIKPTASATYGNALTIIDEMLVNDVKRYMLTELNDEEKALFIK